MWFYVLILTFFFGFRTLLNFFLKTLARFLPVDPIYGRLNHTFVSSGSISLGDIVVQVSLTNLLINFFLMLQGKLFQDANFLTSLIPALKFSIPLMLFPRRRKNIRQIEDISKGYFHRSLYRFQQFRSLETPDLVDQIAHL